MIYVISNQVNAFEGNFKQITTEEAISRLQKMPEQGLDTETTGLNCRSNKLLLVQLGNSEDQYVFDFTSFSSMPPLLKEHLENPKFLFILQNAKFDIGFLYNYGVVIKNVYDTMLVEQIITNGLDQPVNLAYLVYKYCGETMDKSERDNIIKKGITSAGICYGAKDIQFLLDIKRKQMAQVKALELDRAVKLDNSFVKALAYVEFCGIKLDWEKWVKKCQSDKDLLQEKQQALINWLWENNVPNCFCGMDDLFSSEGPQQCILNWNSPKQMVNLFEGLGVDCTLVEKGVKKKTAGAKFFEDKLDKHPLIPLYVEYKKFAKLCSTYGLNWSEFITKETGRVHSTFRQIQKTGRMASGDADEGFANIQNLPHDKLTRSCFIAEPGCSICACDYSSQEQKILANFSKEENLLGFYAKGLADMHSYIAFLMYPEIRECALEDITNDVLDNIKKNHKEERGIAKKAGFAINYGGNGSTIAKNTGLSRSQGDFVYESYFNSFPNLRDHFDKLLEEALRNKYITFNNVTKRKYFLKPDSAIVELEEMVKDPKMIGSPSYRRLEHLYDSEVESLGKWVKNFPIQGSASDITKLACVYFMAEIIKKGWLFTVKMVNIVHDGHKILSCINCVNCWNTLKN